MSDFNNQLKRAELLVGILRAAGYDAHLIGGALRVQALGGTTNDFDIAVITSHEEARENLNRDLVHIVAPRLGMPFELQHLDENPYNDDVSLFIADWRFEDINVIAYNQDVADNVADLVNTFDLNINQYYIDEDGVLCNDAFKGVYVELNPKRLGHNPHIVERVARFKEQYPTLDWSSVDVKYVECPIYGGMYE